MSDRAADDPYRWRRHPQLRRLDGVETLHPRDDASASSLARRGIVLAQRGRFEEAGHTFALAAREPSCDITDTPGFWSLSRRGMHEAITAYERAGRFRDAAALAARIRTTYRPRVLAPMPRPRTLDDEEAMVRRERRQTGAG